MNDWEFSILGTIDALGGEADLRQLYEALWRHYPPEESNRRKVNHETGRAYEQKVRRHVFRLSEKEHLIRQQRGRYSLSYIGRQTFLNELAARQPNSALVKRERNRKQLIFSVRVEALEEGGYLAVCEDIQGCLAEGNTLAEALLNLEDAAVELLKLHKQDGRPTPSGEGVFKPGDVLETRLIAPLPG